MFIVLNVLVTDEVVQFLTTNKLCDLLVTRGLADDESCVKASAMLALSSVMTTPQLAEKHSQQHTSQLVSVVTFNLFKPCICL